jgi:hypothetical protein
MFRKNLFSSAALAAYLAFGASTANAIPVVTTYSDQASFLSTAGLGLSLVTFEGLGGSTYQTLSNAQSSLIPSGVTFSSTPGALNDLFVAPSGFIGQPDIDSDSLFANFFGTALIASFTPGVTAIGSELISSFGSAAILVTIEDMLGIVTSLTVTPAASQEAYLGVVVTGGQITRISWDPPDGIAAGIDDFRFGQAAGVPEPASLALVGLGLAGLGFTRRRKRA